MSPTSALQKWYEMNCSGLTLRRLSTVLTLVASVGGVVAVSPIGQTLGAVGTAYAAADGCGYPVGTTGLPATVFNENTLAKLIQVNGTGASFTISVFGDDENAVLLGIGATAMPATTAAAGPLTSPCRREASATPRRPPRRTT